MSGLLALLLLALSLQFVGTGMLMLNTAEDISWLGILTGFMYLIYIGVWSSLFLHGAPISNAYHQIKNPRRYSFVVTSKTMALSMCISAVAWVALVTMNILAVKSFYDNDFKEPLPSATQLNVMYIIFEKFTSAITLIFELYHGCQIIFYTSIIDQHSTLRRNN